MDILAHGLWAGAGSEVLRRNAHISQRSMGGIVLLAMLPDVLQLVPMIGWVVVGDGSMKSIYEYAIATPGTEPALPPMLKTVVYHLHCVAHSAIVAGAVTLLVWLLHRQWLVPLLGWWSHIVIDVFTHSNDYYPTPVLYPISYIGFDGVAWNAPTFMLLNYVLLVAAYAWLLRTRERHPS